MIKLPVATGKRLQGIPAMLEDIQMMTDSFREDAHYYVFKVGERLIKLKDEAKAQGVKWGEVCQRLPFDARTAQKFMKIASNEALSKKTTHASFLPADYTTLYTLARIPEPDLEQHIEAGHIRPDMSRQEASALARSAAPSSKAPAETCELMKAPGQRAYISPAKVLKNIGTQLEGIGLALSTVEQQIAALGQSDAAEIAILLSDALRPLNRITKSIREHASTAGAAG